MMAVTSYRTIKSRNGSCIHRACPVMNTFFSALSFWTRCAFSRFFHSLYARIEHKHRFIATCLTCDLTQQFRHASHLPFAQLVAILIYCILAPLLRQLIFFRHYLLVTRNGGELIQTWAAASILRLFGNLALKSEALWRGEHAEVIAAGLVYSQPELCSGDCRIVQQRFVGVRAACVCSVAVVGGRFRHVSIAEQVY